MYKRILVPVDGNELTDRAIEASIDLARQLGKARREYLAGLNKRMKTTTKTTRADLFCEGWCRAVWAIRIQLAWSGCAARAAVESSYREAVRPC